MMIKTEERHMPHDASSGTSSNIALALAAVVSRFGAESGTVHWLAPDGLLHLAAATPGMPEPVLTTIQCIPVGKGMAGLAVQRRSAVTACNIQTDDSGDVRAGARLTGLAGAIVVPILDDDRVIGALGVANRAERTFSDDETTQLLAAGRTLVGLLPPAGENAG